VNISQAAESCGLSTKTVRYYEEIGLVVPSRQECNSYRVYTLGDVERLRFLQRSRVAGFGLDECRELLDLYVNSENIAGHHSGNNVSEKIVRIDQQLIALHALRDTLQGMLGNFKSEGQLSASGSVTAPVVTAAKRPAAMPFTLVDTGDHSSFDGSL
jgi:MerR family transcriptional regulator, copper efflux regulator